MTERVLRFGLGVVAVLAAAVLAVTCYGWLRSWRQTDDITWHTTRRMTRFRTSGGGFWFETRPWPNATPPGTQWEQYTGEVHYPFAVNADGPLLQRTGFLVTWHGYDLLIVAPYWFVCCTCGGSSLVCAAATLARRVGAPLRSE